MLLQSENGFPCSLICKSFVERCWRDFSCSFVSSGARSIISPCFPRGFLSKAFAFVFHIDQTQTRNRVEADEKVSRVHFKQKQFNSLLSLSESVMYRGKLFKIIIITLLLSLRLSRKALQNISTAEDRGFSC